MKRIFITALLISLIGFMYLSAQERIYTPSLSLPANNSVDQMPDVVLDWNAVTGGNTGFIKYDVQLDEDPAFTSPANYQTELVSAYQTTNLLFGGTYYWRVRAIDGADVSGWSETWSFRVIRRVVLKNPTDASEVDPDMQLVWNPLTGIDTYDYQIDTIYYWNTVEAGQTGTMYGVAVVDATHAWIVGAAGVVVFFDGTSFVEQESNITSDLYDVSFVDANNGWACAKDGKIIYFDGTAWTTMTSNTTKQLNGIHMLSATNGWAVGKDGTIMHYNGSAWASQTSGTTKELTKVCAVDANHAWAVSKGGDIVFYNGSAWAVQESGTAKDIYDVGFASANYGWAVGKSSLLIEYKDGIWTPLTNSLSNNRDLNSVYFISPTDAYAVGKSGAVLQYDGIEWFAQSGGTNKTLNGFGMVGTVGFMVGEAGIVVGYNDDAFSSPIATIHNVPGDQTTANLSELMFGTQYFWRVRAKHDLAMASWSGARSFIVVSTVVLDKPPNNTTNANLDIELKWKSVSNLVTYEIQIDDDAAFGSPILLATSAITKNAEMLKFGTAYNWRVRAIHALDASDWSEAWKFTTVNTVTLESPANNATDVKLSPLLSWTAITGLAGYEVQLANNSSFNNLLADEIVASPERTLAVPLVLEKDASYYWRVRGVNGLDTSNWSATWTFRTTPPVGIGEIGPEHEMDIYPNPAKNVFYIEEKGNQARSVQMTMTDLVGQKVLDKQIVFGQGDKTKPVDVSGLQKGIYLVRISYENNTITKKLIIK